MIERIFCQNTQCWVTTDGSSVSMPCEILPYGVESVLDVLYWNIVREKREKMFNKGDGTEVLK